MVCDHGVVKQKKEKKNEEGDHDLFLLEEKMTKKKINTGGSIPPVASRGRVCGLCLHKEKGNCFPSPVAMWNPPLCSITTKQSKRQLARLPKNYRQVYTPPSVGRIQYNKTEQRFMPLICTNLRCLLSFDHSPKILVKPHSQQKKK